MARRRDSAALVRLDRARLLGAVAIGVLGQFTVDYPGGYFGATASVTGFGVGYSILVALLAAAAAVLRRRNRPASAILASIVYSVNAGVFVAALSGDPVVAGGVILWHVILLGQAIFRAPRAAPWNAPTGPVDDWMIVEGAAARHLLGVSLLATIVVIGYQLGGRVPGQVMCLALNGAALWWIRGLALRLVQARHPAILPAGLAVVGAVLLASRPDAAIGMLGVAQAVLLGLIVIQRPTFQDFVRHFYRNPAALMLGAFVALIAVGAVLLSFPASSATGTPITAVDAVFTATSAACVTGLVVLDTPHDFSRFGQAVILLLIQVGGWNIMVLSAFAALAVGRGFGLRGRRAISELLDVDSTRSSIPLIRFIILSTLLIEAAGAAVLGTALWTSGVPSGEAAWHAVFHAVSAFCNAGFSLHSDSMIRFRHDPTILLTVAALISLGGVGFGVLSALWFAVRRRARSGVGTHVRVVLVASAVLTFGGALWFAAAEWHHSLAGLSAFDKAINALFQSVTLRTAGFNSIELERLAPGTSVAMMALMLIGASPGGAGGGIKTTTAVVLLSAIPALATGKARVTVLGRAVPVETIFRSTAIGVLAVLLTFLGTFALLTTQEVSLEAALFEAVSAFGTVGLSLGATAGLDGFGKAIIVVLMLLGRIGPLSAALLIARRSGGRAVHPEARLMVG